MYFREDSLFARKLIIIKNGGNLKFGAINAQRAMVK